MSYNLFMSLKLCFVTKNLGNAKTSKLIEFVPCYFHFQQVGSYIHNVSIYVTYCYIHATWIFFYLMSNLLKFTLPQRMELRSFRIDDGKNWKTFRQGELGIIWSSYSFTILVMVFALSYLSTYDKLITSKMFVDIRLSIILMYLYMVK